MNSRIEQLKEYAKIIKDTPYALKTYLQTFDNTQKKYVPMDLFPDQIQLIKDYENFNENITRKYRQAGVTTVTAAWISKKLQTAKPENPERVLIIANKRDTAIEMANKVRHFLEQWPEWINVGFSPDKNAESRFKLNNGCEVKAVATSADALRGYTPTILVFDEAAYIEAGEERSAQASAPANPAPKQVVAEVPTHAPAEGEYISGIAKTYFDLPLREARDLFEKAYFEHQMQIMGRSMTKISDYTGLERTHLYRKLKALGIDTSRNKGEQ